MKINETTNGEGRVTRVQIILTSDEVLDAINIYTNKKLGRGGLVEIKAHPTSGEFTITRTP